MNIEANTKDVDIETFAGYRLLKQCGRGAFGEVFLAEDLMGNRVALKRFFGKRVDIRELNALKRYMRIAPHPSICRIYHCGIEDGTLYYIMELADNTSDSKDYSPDTLAARLSGHKRISFDEALKYCEDIASALERIHGAGLTHRDIKPENIIFVNGCPKITDFGLLSDLALTQSIAGTLGFMPPELLAGKHVKGSSSDIYALGKLLYCSVTGMDAADYPSLPKGLPHETLRRLCLPIAKICAKDPEERCHSCSECIGLLKSMRAEPPGRLRSIWWQLRLNSGFRRSLAIVSLAILLIVAAIVFFGGRLYSQRCYEQRKIWHSAHENLDSLCHALEKMFLLIPKETYGDIIASNGDTNLTLGELTDGYVRLRLADFCALSETEPSSAKDILSPPSKSSEYLETVRRGLHDYALTKLPPLPDDKAPFAERYDALAVYFGYLDSPLGQFLDESERSALYAKAIAISNTLASNYSPRLGLQFTPPCIPPNISGWNFVPPCSFKSPVSGEIRSIDKPFWIFGDLVRNEIYCMFTDDPRNYGKEVNEPVTNACWNDILYFCRRLELAMKKLGTLPPGYGVRPPTEDEWECVASGGWSPKENPFNVAAIGNGFLESVLGSPEHVTPEMQKDFIIMRGASERESDRALTRWEPMYKDSHFVRNLCFRPVVAPKDDDFFEKEWYTAPVWRTFTKDNKIYGNINTCFACFSIGSVQKFCELLGCSMYEPSSMKELEEIFNEFQINTSFPCMTGISFRDGAWKSNSTGENSTLENLPEPADGMNLLGAKPNALYAFSEKTKLPSIITVWKNRDAFEKRLDFWKSPWEHFIKIEVAGKTYALCRLNASSYSSGTIAELLGTRVAMFKKTEELDELCRQLAGIKGTIAIGARRHIDGWRWHDGSIYAGENPERQPDETSFVTYMHDSLGIHNGKVCACNLFDWLLLEMPK